MAIFGNNIVGTDRGNIGQLAIYLCRFTTPAVVGEITNISAYLRLYDNATGAPSGRGIIYSDNNGRPYNFLALSPSDTVISSSPSWHEFPISYTPPPNTPIWIGVLLSDQTNFYATTGVTNQTYFDDHFTYPAPPTDIYNGFAALAMSVYATYLEPGPYPPTADFTYTKNLLTVNVDASPSVADNGATITSYGWDWGDGSLDSGVTASHTYASAGQYGIVLTVTDSNGLTDTFSQVVSVSTAIPPTANFVATPTNLVVVLDASSSQAGTHPITAYAWDFGDGTTNTVATPATSKTYAVAGTYTITLTVYDNGGNSDTVSQDVTVVAGPLVINGVTPWDSQTAGISLETGNYQIEVPPSVVIGGKTYNFIQWENGDTNRIRTFALAGDMVLNPTFLEPAVNYTLAISSTTGGTTNPSGTQTYNAGTIVTVTETPNNGFAFSNWLLDGVNAGSATQINVTMNANHTLQAIFTPITVTHMLTIRPPIVGGTTNPSGTQTVAEGTVIQVTAIPANGYQFDYWLRDGVNAGNTNPIPITMDTDHTLEAIFSQIITVVNLYVVAGVGGTVSPSGQLPLTPNVSYQFNATAGVGYDFLNWDLAGTNKGSSESLILLATSAMDGQTLTALFTTEPPPKVTVTLAVTGNGAIDIGTGAKTFNVGDTVTLTAIPRAGETFVGWHMNGTDYADNPLNLTITAEMANKTLTADFTTLIQAGFPIWVAIPVSLIILIGGYAVSRKGKKSRGVKLCKSYLMVLFRLRLKQENQ